MVVDGERIDGNSVREQVQVKIHLFLVTFTTFDFANFKSLNFVFLRTRV